MKASSKESQAFSDAIDSVNNGMETIINFYNELEDDKPFLNLDDDVIEGITMAKEKYGEDFIDQKINAIVKEMISWLSLEETKPTKTDKK